MARPALKSCLYECAVMHQRLAPKKHGFQYRIFLFCLDLDEIDTVADRVFGFSRNRFNLYSFRDSDHLPFPGKDAKDRLRLYLREKAVELPERARVVLITLPRVMGYIFNPVSFYFCFDEQDVPICAVAQVGNTFGEMKPYLLTDSPEPGVFRLVTPKHFYVSPFSDLELCFDFKLRLPGEELRIQIDDRAGDQKVLLSTLTGQRVALTSRALLWMTVKYPLVTLRVIFLIHWHALLLWAKRLPFHRKTANAHLQRDVMKPHASISGKSS